MPVPGTAAGAVAAASLAATNAAGGALAAPPPPTDVPQDLAPINARAKRQRAACWEVAAACARGARPLARTRAGCRRAGRAAAWRGSQATGRGRCPWSALPSPRTARFLSAQRAPGLGAHQLSGSVRGLASATPRRARSRADVCVGATSATRGAPALGKSGGSAPGRGSEVAPNFPSNDSGAELRPKFGQSWPKFGQSWPILGFVGASLGDILIESVAPLTVAGKIRMRDSGSDETPADPSLRSTAAASIP